MINKLLLALLGFLAFMPGLVTAQANPTSSTSLSGIYDFDSFSFDAPLPGPGDHLKLKASFRDRYLVLEATVAGGWHVYSITQPAGGTIPSAFKFELPQIKLDEIRPLTAPHVDDAVPGFDVSIESHENTVFWLFTFDKPLSADQPIQGQFTGQVCQSGEGGTCIPLTIDFSADYDPKLDTEGYLSRAKDIPDRFIKRLTAPKESSQVPADDSIKSEYSTKETTRVEGMGTALIYALLGGLILNFMPCVLPVIGLKILSFFEQAGKSRARAFMLNLWYSLGLMSVFMFLAFLSYGLSILFTFDLFHIIMVCVVFAMALSLMEVWELSVPGFLGSGMSGELMRREGAFGAFFKGIITTLLAIPCGAPLLSPAVNWADIQFRSGNSVFVFVAYGVIGFGMALPYLIIGAFPELLRFLPKPGPWMDTFKKTMGFCLLVAVVWILYFIQLERTLPTIALLFALWFACWMVGRLGYTASWKARIQAWLISLAVVLVTVVCAFQIPGIENGYNLENAMKTRIERYVGASVSDLDATDVQTKKHWVAYSPQRMEKALQAGRPVLVDFTADWCVNCKVLEATVLETEAVLNRLDEKQVLSLVGDCTREGEAKVLLRKLGSDQVPVLALFDPAYPNKPTVLRGFYTQKKLLELLDQINSNASSP